LSATGRSATTGYERHPDDFFRTPAWTTKAVLPHLKLGDRPIVLDPFCGDGAILDAVSDVYPHAVTYGIEIDADRAKAAGKKHRVTCGDAFAVDFGSPTCIITNPSFSKAMVSLERSLPSFKDRIDVAFLLRLNFLGSAKRAEFHKANPCDVFVLPKRPEFCASITCRIGRPSAPQVGCGWHVTLPIDADRPKVCIKCGASGLTVTTTDATEYMWAVWGPGRGGRWSILDLPAAEEEKAA
jgi:hypothetical protein